MARCRISVRAFETLIVVLSPLIASIALAAPTPDSLHSDRPPDTTRAAEVRRIDIRTGSEGAYRSIRLTPSGAIDQAWVPDSATVGFAYSGTTVGAPDEEGGRILVWAAGRGEDTDILAQGHSSASQVDPAWPFDGVLVSGAAYSQDHPAIAPDGSGGAFIAWQDFRSGSSNDIYAQRLTAQGVLAEGWPEQGLAVCVAPGEQCRPGIVSDGSGGAFVIWQDSRNGVFSLFSQHVTGQGSIDPTWPDGQPVVAGGAAVGGAAIVLDAGGGMIMAWVERVDSLSARLRVLRREAAGELVGGDASGLVVTESPAALGTPAIVPHPTGGAYVAWSQYAPGGGPIRLQRITGTAAVASGWPDGGLELGGSRAGLAAPLLEIDAEGDAVLCWEDLRNGIDSDLYLLRISDQGAIPEGWATSGALVCRAPGDQYAAEVAFDDSGGVVVTWHDARDDVESGDLLLMRQTLTQNAVRLSSAEAKPGVARLVWSADGDLGLGAHVYRQRTGMEWEFLEKVQQDGEAAFRVEDRRAPAGETVEYRLSLVLRGVEYFLSPVDLAIPPFPTVLALSRARVAASGRALLATVALPTGDPAKLELLDVAGRRLTAQSVGGLGPGEHDVSIPLPTRAAPGIYFARLVQGHVRRTTKIAYTR